VVTTNLTFAEWVTVFGGDEKLTTALLDPLAHHASVITQGTVSEPLAHKRMTEPGQQAFVGIRPDASDHTRSRSKRNHPADYGVN
jgi:hypothetical protein